MYERDRGDEIGDSPRIPGIEGPTGTGGRPRGVVAFGCGEKRDREFPRSKSPDQGFELLRLVLIAPLVSDDRVVTLFYALLLNRKVFIPECEVGVYAPGFSDHLLFELHRKSVAHVDHDTVDPKCLLVVWYNIGDALPKPLIDEFRSRQAGIIHTDGVISDIVEVLMVIHFEKGDIPPRGLGIVRGPVGKCSRYPYRRMLREHADVSPVPELRRFFPWGLGE